MSATNLVSNFCRICAQQSNDTQHLFEMMHNTISLAEMLAYCLKRPIIKSDNLPNTICLNCAENLISTYDFHKLCESSENILLEMFASNDDNGMPSEIKSEIECINIGSDFSLDYKPEQEYPPEPNFTAETFDHDMKIHAENSSSSNPIAQLRNCNSIKTNRKRKKWIKMDVQDTKLFECFQCKEEFKQLCDLRAHIRDHESGEKPFECKTCKAQFAHLKSWSRHCFRHTQNIYDCEYCDEAYKTLRLLKHHIQEIHKDRLSAYQCDQCPKKFPLRFLLVWHYVEHKRVKRIVCPTCDAVFFNDQQLKSHIRDTHESKYKFYLFENVIKTLYF